jgi:hypothetical protein
MTRRVSVRVNSGTIKADFPLRDVPRDQWETLVSLRRRFLATELTYDCRCLVDFIKEGESLWKPLGYISMDDFITRGYALESEEIRLAVRWLELNEPETPVGLPEVLANTASGRTQAAARVTTGEVLPKHAHPDSQFTNQTQASRAEKSGISKRQQEKLDALATKDPVRFAEVQAGTKSCHRACVEAGIVKAPSTLDRLRKVLTHLDTAELSAEQRREAAELLRGALGKFG